jgi:hypothetical protein
MRPSLQTDLPATLCPPPANRSENIFFASKSNARDDVGGARAPGDDSRTAIDHGVRNGTGGVVAWIAGAQRLSSNGLAKALDGGWRNHKIAPQDLPIEQGGLRRSAIIYRAKQEVIKKRSIFL